MIIILLCNFILYNRYMTEHILILNSISVHTSYFCSLQKEKCAYCTHKMGNPSMRSEDILYNFLESKMNNRVKTKCFIFVQTQKAEYSIIMFYYHTSYHHIITTKFRRNSKYTLKKIKSHTDLAANGFGTLNVNILYYILPATSLQ